MRIISCGCSLRRACLLFALIGLALGGVGAVSAETPDAAASDMRPAVIAPDLPEEGPVRDDLDAYGGWKGLSGQATGFFHVEQLGGRWWFVTPEGHAFFMLALGWSDKKSNLSQIKSWGFNSIEEAAGMPYSLHLNFCRQNQRKFLEPGPATFPPWASFPDVFDPEWPAQCQELAQRELAPRANDPMLIGYFTDNELCYSGWYGCVLQTPKDAPCRPAFVAVARAYYAKKPDALARDWKSFNVSKVEDILTLEGTPPDLPDLEAAWVSAVAERALSVVAAAAKAAAPHHLNLGSRLYDAPPPAPGVLAAMAKYWDVISLNLYSLIPDRLITQVFTLVPTLNALTGKPTLTSEFSYRGCDTGLPNTMGALPSVKTQAERAIGYLSYVSALASIPSHIGVSWYKYPEDAPKRGWDSYAEDCNFGVIDNQNRPYAVLTQGMRTTNASIYELAADPVHSSTCPLFWRTELTRWDVPGDALLFQRMLHSDQPFVDPLAQALPEPRRYHPNYWVQHRGPKLTVNDDRFSGWCQANLVKHGDDGTTVAMLNIQALMWLPRSLWLGPQCKAPDDALAVESNAQFLSRQIAPDGRLLRLTLADGSYIRTDATMDLRLDAKTAYLDLRFNADAKELAITVRGPAQYIGVNGTGGWKATWNSAPLNAAQTEEKAGMTVYTEPK